MGNSMKDFGRQADESATLGVAVRVGLVCYGIVHVLIAWLAISLALGDKKGSASSDGALSELAQKPFGSVMLYGIAAGFAALVLWQFIDAVAGNRDQVGYRRALRQAGSLGRAVIFGALGYSAFKVAIGSQSSGEGKTNSMTARLMSMPAGPVIVAAVGLAIISVGCVLLYRGLSESFIKDLSAKGRRGLSGRAYITIGKIGFASKAVAFSVVGGLFVWAALTQDSKKSGGLDQALHTVLEQPFGSVLLIVVGAGIGSYGLFCFAEARHLDR